MSLSEEESYEADLWYAEVETEIAIGVDFHGLRPSAGGYVSTLFGETEFNGTVDSTEVDLDADLTATNVGFFLEVYYKNPDFPLFASARALSGDVEGVVFSLGASF
jgi:hypothetical protein